MVVVVVVELVVVAVPVLVIVLRVNDVADVVVAVPVVTLKVVTVVVVLSQAMFLCKQHHSAFACIHVCLRFANRSLQSYGSGVVVLQPKPSFSQHQIILSLLSTDASEDTSLQSYIGDVVVVLVAVFVVGGNEVMGHPRP